MRSLIGVMILFLSLSAAAQDPNTPGAEQAVGSEGTGPAKITEKPSDLNDTTKKDRLHCGALPEDIKAMREAQSFLLQSMVRKNESLAETLEVFAREFQGKKGRLRPADFKRMTTSAEAYRGHAARERSLVERFETSTNSLALRIEKCLSEGALAEARSQ